MSLRSRASEIGLAISDQNITVLSSATSLTVPNGAVRALCTGRVAALRFRYGGVPTALIGHPLAVGDSVEVYASDIDDIQFIEEAVNGEVFVTYFGE